MRQLVIDRAQPASGISFGEAEKPVSTSMLFRSPQMTRQTGRWPGTTVAFPVWLIETPAWPRWWSSVSSEYGQMEETGETLGVSDPDHEARSWRLARAFLHDALGE